MALIGRGVVLIRDAKLSVTMQRLHNFEPDRGADHPFSILAYPIVSMAVLGWGRGSEWTAFSDCFEANTKGIVRWRSELFRLVS